MDRICYTPNINNVLCMSNSNREHAEHLMDDGPRAGNAGALYVVLLGAETRVTFFGHHDVKVGPPRWLLLSGAARSTRPVLRSEPG